MPFSFPEPEQQFMPGPQLAAVSAPALQVQQQEQPLMAAPMAAPMSYANPYLDMLQSPLMTNQNLQKLQPIYDRYVNHLNGGDKGQQYEDAATRIFGSLIAPSMAIFGGPGTSAAGADMIKQAQADVKQARVNKMAQDQHSLTAIKGLIDISKSGMKPAQEYIKDYRKGVDQNLKGQKQQETANNNAAKLGVREQINRDRVAYQNKLIDLKSRGFDISEAKMNQQMQIAKMNDDRIRQIASINMQLQKRGQDVQLINRKAQLAQEYRRDQMKLEQFNSEITAKLQMKDKDGNLKYSGTDGKLLNAAEYQLQMAGGPGALEEPSDDHLLAAMQEMSQPQAQTQDQHGQQVQAAPQIMQRGTSVFQQMIQQGHTPAQVASMFMQSAAKRGIPLEQALEQLKGFGNGR